MKKKGNKIERFESIDGNKIVWYWGSCPWRELKVLKRNKTYLVNTVGERIYLVKEINKKEIYLKEREVLICLDGGTVYLEKLGRNESVFFTKSLSALLDGAIAVEMWTEKGWERLPFSKNKKEKHQEEEKVIS